MIIMFPKGDILLQNFKTASNNTISSAPYVGHINPMSSAGSHKLLRVSSHHFGQYWQFTSDIIISHACENDIMFTCTLSGYSSPERDNT